MENKDNGLITIRKEGSSKVIAVTKLLPKKWRYITAEIIHTDKSSVTIKFEKVR